MLLTTLFIAACALPPRVERAQPESSDRITILVDAFGGSAELHQDWGYSALVEYGGKRVLFDTGNNNEGFARNVRALGMDLSRLDAVVILHRHGDHTDGLRYLLTVNPHVRIYVPDDEYFGGNTPPVFFRQTSPGLPREMRYFNGAIPDVVPHGSAWRANFVRVDSTVEIAPGLTLVRNIAAGRQFGETPELSLVVQTPTGPVVMVGCSHPGIERILASVTSAVNPHIRLVVGGMHLVTTLDAEVARVISALQKEWGVKAVAPGHCTGERAFAQMRRAFGADYVYAGVGTSIPIT